MRLCEIEGCGRKHKGRGLCAMHLHSQRITDGYKRPYKICSVPDCDGQVLARELCSKHYQARRLQDPDARVKHRANTERWRTANPVEAKSSQRKSMRKRHTGCSHDLVCELQALQAGRCAICPTVLVPRGKAGSSECADHYETLQGVRVKHKTKGATKHVRGLLCVACNYALGMYENHQRPAGLRIPQYEDYIACPPAMRLDQKENAA